ncbi:DJ-1/PfpI family protein [Archangium sp.]|uniref:DJ-1/PfpI family protein n=1 Tax=Archangium sp. TaxID=1872627 RepID=UPI002D725FB2|nr:DJ-1/PfpI family protein [Archangium sp.]HYO58887.1 DJ-1/PfpI family protein [Archangium sp.]
MGLMNQIRIGMVLFPRLNQLDVAGAYEVFARIPDAQVSLVAETRAPTHCEFGLALTPDLTFEEAPPFDILLVPGGRGVNAAMESEPVLSFLRRQEPGATWVTSVCTGALVLGAAGLLRGYRATTHWLSLELLAPLGATPVRERVVVDRNRITGVGITAGIDFGLRLAAELRGEQVAQEIQLTLEYDPAPPFQAGSPRTAPPSLVESVSARRRALQEERSQIVTRAARRLGLG